MVSPRYFHGFASAKPPRSQTPFNLNVMRPGQERLIARSRPKYLALAFGTMMFGLASRSNEFVLPEFIVSYAGDTLWALLVFWLVRVLKPSLPVLQSAFIATGFAYIIELSQFYHFPWIDGIRSTTLGGLVLGFGFSLSDLACYSVGIVIGYVLDIMVVSELEHGRT
jgi:hypothetical protein